MRVLATVRLLVALAAVAAGGAGCHRGEVEEVPLLARLIGISDRFFDVHAFDAERVIVVGYGGKILSTTDGGFTWSRVESGTNRALYRVRFVDANHGWISGQEGLLLHTDDGGKTWKRQKAPTNVYLFSLSFLDENHGWAVGDKSILLETVDGGKNWALHKVVSPSRKQLSAEEAVMSQDPVLYDVQMIDAQTGWVVGEFGSIYHTEDGGKSWTEHQQSLVGGEIPDVLDLPTFFGVHFLTPQEGIVVGLDGRIARTHDGGATWAFAATQLDYPIVDPLFNVRLVPGGGTWAIGAAGEVLHVAEGVEKFQRAKLGMEVLTWLRGMSWRDQNDGWIVGGLGLILHTKDGGKSWIPSMG